MKNMTNKGELLKQTSRLYAFPASFSTWYEWKTTFDEFNSRITQYVGTVNVDMAFANAKDLPNCRSRAYEKLHFCFYTLI